MEYLEGENLELKLSKLYKYPEKLTKIILSKILLIIKKFHSIGFIHRDLKPSNIMICNDGRVKIIDLGSIKILDKSLHAQFLDSEDNKSVSKSLTSSDIWLAENYSESVNTFVGTEAYVSPEVLESGNLGYSVDLWAFGCIAYRMITGTEAF